MESPRVHDFSYAGDKASTFSIDDFLGACFFPITVTVATAVVVGYGREAEIMVRVTENRKEIKVVIIMELVNDIYHKGNILRKRNRDFCANNIN